MRVGLLVIGGLIIDSLPLPYSVPSCAIHGSIASITIYGKRANLHAEIIPLAQVHGFLVEFEVDT